MKSDSNFQSECNPPKDHFWSDLLNVANDNGFSFEVSNYDDSPPQRIIFKVGNLDVRIVKGIKITIIQNHRLGLDISMREDVSLEFYINLIKYILDSGLCFKEVPLQNHTLLRENLANTVKEYFPNYAMYDYTENINFDTGDFNFDIHIGFGKDSEWKTLEKILTTIYQNLT